MAKVNRFDILSRGLRRTRGEMNGAESKYAQWLSAEPDVHRWWFEPFTLRLSHPEGGQPAKLTPDFIVLMTDGVTYVDDVKSGGMNDNASIVRMKAAAELYPLWKFRLVVSRLKRDGGGFTRTEL